VDLKRGSLIAADYVAGEGDVRAGTHAQEVDKAQNGANCLVVSRRERDHMGKGGGVDATVVNGRHG
jgi:hypothetical protein